MSALRFSDKFQLLLRYGDLDGRYEGDGSRQVAALILHGVNVGMPKQLVYNALLDPQNRGGFAALRRRRSNLQRWFDSAWARAQSHAAAHPVIRDRAEAAYRASEFLEVVAATTTWTGRGGATDLAVLRAVVTICQRVGRVSDVGMSCRELAELARVNFRTVHKSLRRLAERGLVRQATASDGHSPSRYSLVLGATHQGQSVSHRCVGPECPRSVAPSDVWRWFGGLGLSTRRVFTLLGVDPVRRTA